MRDIVKLWTKVYRGKDYSVFVDPDCVEEMRDHLDFSDLPYRQAHEKLHSEYREFGSIIHIERDFGGVIMKTKD